MLAKSFFLKTIYISAILITCLYRLHAQQEPVTSNNTQKLIIGARSYGFFSEFFVALQNTNWCEQNNKKAVIYWDKACTYYEPNGFNDSQNAWEYYFEPVSDARYEPGDVITHDYVTPDGFNIPFWDLDYIETIRPLLAAIIKKYIKLKPYVTHTVEDFYYKNMANCILIGVHLRGTDKGLEAYPINPLDVINKAQEYASMAEKIAPGKRIKFFVASDEQRLIDFARKNLQGTVITYDQATRSTSNIPVHDVRSCAQKEPGYCAKLGHDVLVEALLLAQCHFFAHTKSNVSTAVILFNPDLIHYQCNGYAKLD